MTTETEPIQERLRPRIVETEEIGRLDLRLPVVPEPGLGPERPRRGPSPFAVAVSGLGILVVGVAAIQLAAEVGRGDERVGRVPAQVVGVLVPVRWRVPGLARAGDPVRRRAYLWMPSGRW